jgi:Contractile injection system tube protein
MANLPSSFPGSPKLQRGALVALYTPSKRTVIEFQYNPDTLTRQLIPQASTESDDIERGEALRLKGPPQETISLEIEIDATDLLEKGDKSALTVGIYPALSALEALLYPHYQNIEENDRLAKSGFFEVVPQEAPLTLFVWGKKRILPVRLTNFSTTEESFDPDLNPIRAKMSLGLQVLTYNDLGFNTPGGRAFISHHKMIEQMAGQYSSANSGTQDVIRWIKMSL